jgi:hypothetical protein
MHMAARSGNQAVLLAMVNKIGAGAVQIVQNKQSKVWLVFFPECLKKSLILKLKEFQLLDSLAELYKRNILERLVTSSRGMFSGSHRGRQNSAPTPRSY